MENTVKEKAWDNIVAVDGMITNKSTVEFVGRELDYNCYKNKF